jgi:hypothetical protein
LKFKTPDIDARIIPLSQERSTALVVNESVTNSLTMTKAGEPLLALPSPGVIPRTDVPAFGIAVVNEEVFNKIFNESKSLGQKGSTNPGFFADPFDLVGLSDQAVVQRLGNPGLAKSAVTNNESIFGLQFPTNGQPIFNTLGFDDPNFVSGGVAVLRGPDGPNSFIMQGVREFNVPPAFKLPEGTIGGKIVNGSIKDAEVIK